MAHYVGILDGKGKVWGVRIPDLPGCYGGGATAEAAMADAMSAAREWIAHKRSKGETVPNPRNVAQLATAGEIASLAAAPAGPPMIHSDSRRALRMCSRSACSSVVVTEFVT